MYNGIFRCVLRSLTKILKGMKELKKSNCPINHVGSAKICYVVATENVADRHCQ